MRAYDTLPYEGLGSIMRCVHPLPSGQYNNCVFVPLLRYMRANVLPYEGLGSISYAHTPHHKGSFAAGPKAVPLGIMLLYWCVCVCVYRRVTTAYLAV